MTDMTLEKQLNVNKFIVVINRHKIKANRGKPIDQHEPPVRVSAGKHGKPEYRYEAIFDCRVVRVIYDPEHPLPCGATTWVEIT